MYVLARIGEPSVQAQGCDNAVCAQTLILMHLFGCFRLLKHWRLPQAGSAGSPSTHPTHPTRV